jgi:hypothetical protein
MPITPASRPPLRLADHVRACHTDGQVILLDLRRNKYVGIGGAPLQALTGTIENWPAVGPQPSGLAAEPVDIDSLTAPLLSQGLLARATTAGPATPGIEEALRSLNAEDAVQDTPIGWRQLSRFVHGAAAASAWLRWRSLATIVDIVAARQARLAAHRTTPNDAMRNLVAAYLRLRPFVFSAHDRCLHDSLALTHFLGAHGVAAQWVIGVRTQPFGAHSWVQCGDTVLNDQHEHARRYQPILVV